MSPGPNFNGHYVCAFDSVEVMLAGREYLGGEADLALAGQTIHPPFSHVARKPLANVSVHG